MLRRHVLILGSFCAALACSQEPESRPPACETCAPDPGSNSGGGGRDGGSDAADGAALTEAGARSVTGSVELIESDDFATVSAFGGRADIEMEAAAGGYVSTSYDGVSFQLDGVLGEPGVWAAVLPAVAADTLPTLQPTDPLAPNVVLDVVRASTIDFIFNLLAVPPVRSDLAGQLVLRFVDADTGNGRAGVSIVEHAGVAVVYAAGGSWSDAVTATDPSGLVIVANSEAVSYPGSLQKIVFADSGSTFETRVMIARGAVSLVHVGL